MFKDPSLYPPHPAVDWSTTRSSAHGEVVEITCPVCHQVREANARSVRYQVRGARFTGRCSKDRLVNHTRSDSPLLPQADNVNWEDRVLVTEGGGRRRSMVRVVCPECNAARLYHPHQLRLQVLAGLFQPGCPLHRRRHPIAEIPQVQQPPTARPEFLESPLAGISRETRAALVEHLRRDVDAALEDLLADVMQPAKPAPRPEAHAPAGSRSPQA